MTEELGFVERLRAALPDTVGTALSVKGSSIPSKSLLVLLPFISHLRQWWLLAEVSKPRKNRTPHFKHLRMWGCLPMLLQSS
jgi:hypothetical protein